MQKKIVWVVVSYLMVLALLATSCAKAEEKAPVPAGKEATPVVKEAAPVVKEAAPAAAEKMVKVTLTKLDGTKMEKLVEKPKYGGVVTVAYNAPILNWDEAYIAPWLMMHNISVVNEELLAGDWTRGPGGTGETEWFTGGTFVLPYMTGSLAESWELVDPVTLVFHIRKGVKWALNPNSAASRLVNGRELTADDIVWNIKRIYFDITFSTALGMAGASKPVDVYATDKYTVVVKASSPGQAGPTLQYASDWVRMMAPEVGKKYGDFQAWENSVGTGPFMLTDYVPMSSATYIRNPNYWGKDPLFPENQLPYLDGIKLLVIVDMSTLRAAYRTAQITWNVGFSLLRTDMKPLVTTTPELKYKKFIHSVSKPAGRVDKPELPFKDIRVRRALMLATDHPAMLKNFYDGEGQMVAWTVPPAFKDAYTPLEELPPSTRELYEYHPDKAKQLLAEAGYPNGFKTEMVVSSAVGQADLASIFKEYWAKVGVDLTIDVKDIGIYESIYQRKTFKEMYQRGTVVYGSAYEMWNTRTGNIYNWAMCSDPWIDQKYDELSALFFEPAKRAKLLKEINLYILDKAWYTVPPAEDTYLVWWPWLKNYNGEFDMGAYNRPGLQLRIAWLDQELKKAMGR